MQFTSDDAEIFYEVRGQGPPVVLLHPFPAHHELWGPAAQALESRYRLIMPDLRGHGESGIGEGPATMAKHAADLIRLLDREQIQQAAFAGVSIGGYALFELWRRSRERFAALVLMDTRAQADGGDARTARLKAADDVLEHGTESFVDSMLSKLLGQTTQLNRPDLVEGAKRMMLKMSAEDVSSVQRGMAERPDSVSTLKSIHVPTLILVGNEDVLTPVAEAEAMRKEVSGSQMKVIPRGGHYAVWEQPEEVGKTLRQFLDASYR